MQLDSAIFYTTSVNKLIHFYKDLLSFHIEYQEGDDYISFIFQNNARLAVKKVIEEREIVGAQTVIIAVTNIEDLFNTLKDKEIKFKEFLTSQPWGKEFILMDPDGNQLEFLERT